MRVFDSYKIVRHIFNIHEEKFKPLLQDKVLLELYNKYSEAMHEALRAIDNHAALPYKWFSDESLCQKVEALEEAYDATKIRLMGKNSEKYPDLVPVPQPPPEKTKKEKKPRQKRKKKEPKNVTKEKESKRLKLTESLPPPPPPAPSQPSPSYLPLPESVNVPAPVIEVLATGGPLPPPPQQQDSLQSRSPIQVKEEENGTKEIEESVMALDIERQLQEFYDQMCAGMKKLTIHDED